MKSFRNLQTRTKHLLAFGLMIGLLLITMATAYNAIVTIRDSQQRMFNREFAAVVYMVDLRADLNRQRARMLEMTLTTDAEGLNALLRDLRAGADEIDDEMQKLGVLNRDDPGFLARLAELKSALAEYRQGREAQIALIFEGKGEEARRFAREAQTARFKKIGVLATDLGDRMLERTRAEVNAAGELASRSINAFVLLGCLAVVLGIAMTVVLNRLISRPLRDLTVVAERITIGDLNVEVPQEMRFDEVGVLARAFDRMTKSLRAMAGSAGRIADGDLRTTIEPQSEDDMLGRAFARMTSDLRAQIRALNDGANAVGTAASEIVAATSQLAASASESAAAVSETTTTVEEVRQTAELASQRARDVSDSAQKAAQASQSGLESTEALMAAMARIGERMDSIAAGLMRLSEQSQAIGQIVATVEDLSAQSNLLAVNAAIEAAKAGEHGKGFGVVAQEVRTLAEQSREATNQVRTILGDIQKATASAVMLTEQGTKAVESGSREAGTAGEAIQSLTGSVTEAAQAATQIAASSQQQLIGVDQVAGAMESIRQASTQNVASAHQLESAARNLEALGQRLKHTVERYEL